MCQINNIKKMGVDNPGLKVKKDFRIILRMVRVFLFIQEMRKFKTKKIVSEKEDSKEPPYPPARDMKPGNTLRVRSKEQILQTLDKDKRFEGCFFMDEMWQDCGSQHKVIKRVDYSFDERGSRLYMLVILFSLRKYIVRENKEILCPDVIEIVTCFGKRSG
jgi:hypothetical protein